MRRGWRRAAATAAVAAGLVIGWLGLTHATDVTVVDVALAVAIGWAYIAAGLVLARHRPRNRVAAVLLGIGFAWLAQFLRVVDYSLPATAGWLLSALPLAGLVALALAFPSGRLQTRTERALVAAALVLATAGQVAWMVVRPVFPTCAGCAPPPANAILVQPDAGLADAIELIQNGVGALVGITAAVLLVRRWRGGTPALRRQAAPLLWLGAAASVVAALALVSEVAGRPLGELPWLALSLLIGAMPVVVVWVLVRRRMDRAGVASLVVDLGGRSPLASLPAALARTLGDPTLELLYWLPEQRRYVDSAGRVTALPAGRSRSVTEVERGGARIAALVHDPVLDDDPELVASVCAAAALALENERLQVELRARARDLQASRARLVAVGDRERRRIERDLHDGAQQSLVSVAMTLGLARARQAGGGDVGELLGEAQGQLEDALAELRELSRGLLPPLLRERGLEAALRELARRAPLAVTLDVGPLPPLPPAAEAALFFVVSEALTNVSKHAGVDRAEVGAGARDGGVGLRVSDRGTGAADPDGSGLRGLADRVGGLGGTLAVRERRPHGTVIEVWVPCGS